MKGFKGFFSRFSIIILFVGCAQKKADREPDRTSSVDALLSATMIAESDGNIAATSQSDFITASSEQNRGVISNVSGPPVFAELIRHKIGIIIPLLLIQRIFGDRNPIAPPDFLILKKNNIFPYLY